MLAYLVSEPNGPFTPVDLPRPIPAAGQVLVRVHASGVNPLDTKIRAGQGAHAQQPLPAVLGLDMAGAVEEVDRMHSAWCKSMQLQIALWAAPYSDAKLALNEW